MPKRSRAKVVRGGAMAGGVPSAIDTSWHPRKFRNFFSIPDRYVDFFYGEVPDTEVLDNGRSITVRVDFQGIESKDIKVEVGDRSVVIRGTSTHREHKEDKNYRYSREVRNAYYRHVPLPCRVKKKSAEISFTNHTVEINVDKL